MIVVELDMFWNGGSNAHKKSVIFCSLRIMEALKCICVQGTKS